MPVTATFLWYLVAEPQGGLAVLPSLFDKSEQCRAAGSSNRAVVRLLENIH
jgi:hypothetical protein